MENTEDELVKKIVYNPDPNKEPLQLPQISIDSSGFVMTRPDAFLPPVDIVVTPEDYIIVIDIPGMKKEDIVLKRRNVVTLVKGVRRKSKIT